MDGMLEMPLACSEGRILEAQLSEYRRMTRAQFASSAIRLAAIDDVAAEEFHTYLPSLVIFAAEDIEKHPETLESRIESVRERLFQYGSFC